VILGLGVSVADFLFLFFFFFDFLFVLRCLSRFSSSSFRSLSLGFNLMICWFFDRSRTSWTARRLTTWPEGLRQQNGVRPFISIPVTGQTNLASPSFFHNSAVLASFFSSPGSEVFSVNLQATSSCNFTCEKRSGSSTSPVLLFSSLSSNASLSYKYPRGQQTVPKSGRRCSEMAHLETEIARLAVTAAATPSALDSEAVTVDRNFRFVVMLPPSPPISRRELLIEVSHFFIALAVWSSCPGTKARRKSNVEN